MPTYDFLCKDCGYIHNQVLSIMTSAEAKSKIVCPECSGPTEQTFTECNGFIFKEGHGVESAKPGSYWRGAEKVKQEDLKKRRKAEQEKHFYGDKETIAKAERRKKNARNFED